MKPEKLSAVFNEDQNAPDRTMRYNGFEYNFNIRAGRGITLFGGGKAASESFDAWLDATCVSDATTRDAGLRRWAEAPGGRASHPREEHLLPLMVIAGAAGAEVGKITYNEQILGVKVSAVQFG